MNYRKNNNKVFMGIALITIATVMFLSSFNLIPNGLINQIIGYTLIIYGLYSLIKRSFYVSLFSIAFGLKISPLIFAPTLDFNKIGWFTLIFITMLLATGLETLFGNKYSWKKTYKKGKFSGAEFSNHNQQDLSGEYVNASLNMGEASRYIDSKDLKTAHLNCSFGDLSVYFLNGNIENDVTINVNCKLGNMDLYLPHNWKVVNNINVSLGDVSISQNYPDSEYTVYLNGNVSLANVDVYFN